MIRDLVIESRSVRAYDESQPVTKEILTDLVDTARLTPSAMNRQPLKYRIVSDKAEVEGLLALTKWAAALKDIVLPPEGKHPTGFIAVCHDTDISPDTKSSAVDVGIVSQTMLLEAREEGFGGCMIGNFNADKVSEYLRIPRHCVPVLLIAFGTPDEIEFITEVGEDGNTAYFRDKANIHFVPKRKLKDVIIP